MSFGRKNIILGISAFAAAAMAGVPMATGFAFETDASAIAEADGELLAAGGIEQEETTVEGNAAEPVIELDDTAESLEFTEEAETVATEETAIAYNETVDADLICLVKIVRHEAANQSMTGQLAVAQLVMNRVESPAFPNTICSVAHQRGQFFNTNAYNPGRTDQRWMNAMQVALDARNRVSPSVVEDAVFYHAAYVSPRFHLSRPRVTQIEDHIFYR